MTFCSTRHKRVKGTKYLSKKKKKRNKIFLAGAKKKKKEIKVFEQELKKSKNCGKIANEQIFIAFIYLFIYL